MGLRQMFGPEIMTYVISAIDADSGEMVNGSCRAHNVSAVMDECRAFLFVDETPGRVFESGLSPECERLVVVIA